MTLSIVLLRKHTFKNRLPTPALAVLDVGGIEYQYHSLNLTPDKSFLSLDLSLLGLYPFPFLQTLCLFTFILLLDSCCRQRYL